jgi:hypothetical protein
MVLVVASLIRSRFDFDRYGLVRAQFIF